MENQNLPKVLGESIKNWLSSENQKWHEQQKQLRLQQQEQVACMGQIYIQEALGQVLHATSILPELCSIENCTDLVPSGYTIDEVSLYSYHWLKKTPERISTTMLEIARQKINSAIDIETRRMNIVYQSLFDYEKMMFIQQYPAFYTGFHVVSIKDAGTDVIISAAYD